MAPPELPEAHRGIRETKAGRAIKEDKDIRGALVDQVPQVHRETKAIRE
jgi:hypothetical protein